MISVCCPTRSRPQRFTEMVESARATAEGEIEIIAVIDRDDTIPAYPVFRDVRYITSRIGSVQSDLWNQAWAIAKGDIACMMADDTVFVTPGWNRAVESAFEYWPDRIGVVYTHNGMPDSRPEVPFCSRQWIDAAGFFTPPYFKTWFCDRWITEVAAKVHRRLYLPDVLIEHRHPAYGKADKDMLYAQAEEYRVNLGWEALQEQYNAFEEEREEQAARIRAAMSPGVFQWDGREFVP